MSPRRFLRKLLQFRAMSTATVTVRYDGPILASHQMDVADLAPSLLALSDLCQLANKKFNGDRASVRVLVATDKEHQCFQFDIHVVQNLWEATRSVLAQEDVATAKEILEWLGLITWVGGGAWGLFKALKWIRDRKVTGTTINLIDGKNVVQIHVEGDNNTINVTQQTMDLLRDELAVASAKKVLVPITREGYEKLEFEDTKSHTKEVFEKADAEAIVGINPDALDPGEKTPAQVIEAWVTVYAPVYDQRAQRWRFKFGKVHEYMDISETDIARAAIKRGGALIDDAYRVKLEIVQELKDNGTIKNHYKIREVLEFRPARLPLQADAFEDLKDED